MGISTSLIPAHDDALHSGNAKRGVPNGLASLDAAGKVPIAEVGAVELTTNKDAANGYPGLSALSKIATSQLDTNAANGIAGLDASVLLALVQQRLNFKAGLISYNTATASGTLAITGAGFMPRLVIFIAVVGNAVGELSIGWSNGTNHYCMSDTYNSLANTYMILSSACIYLTQSGGMTVSGVINSMDADGFTIGWTKGGAKTGSGSIIYIAVK